MNQAGQVGKRKTEVWHIKKWRRMLVIVTLIAAGASSALVYFKNLTQPILQPTFSLTSPYSVEHIPAGTIGTILQLDRQQFSSNSLISFLLDGKLAPDTPQLLSDPDGYVRANLTISSAWPLGQHSLAARDANNYTTRIRQLIEVVAPGQASTPGPFDAPSDDASFMASASEQGQYAGDQGHVTLSQ